MPLPPDSPSETLVAGHEVGPYRLVRELGRGGMGSVWLAERADGLVRRQVALKLPHAVWGDAFAERMARERQILSGLSHAHIARLYDIGLDAHGRPWIAMEYVDGERIDTWCRDRDLPVRERLALLLQVLSAVAHAHQRLVVHRDLKPANILVTRDGQTMLLDFGIAKLIDDGSGQDSALTEAADRALTLDYASPEQIRGEPLGTASDVYSLGVVAYELLARRLPYRVDRHSMSLAQAIADVEPARASDAADSPALRKALRGDIDAMLGRALEKDVAHRYPSADAFAQDIRRHLEGEPVRARPASAGYRRVVVAGPRGEATGAGGRYIALRQAGGKLEGDVNTELSFFWEQYDEARSLAYARTASVLQERGAASEDERMESRSQLGDVLLAAGHAAAAEAMLRRSMELALPSSGRQGRMMNSLVGRLAITVAAQGRHAQAEVLLGEQASAMGASGADADDHLIQARLRIAWMAGDVDAAAALLPAVASLDQAGILLALGRPADARARASAALADLPDQAPVSPRIARARRLTRA